MKIWDTEKTKERASFSSIQKRMLNPRNSGLARYSQLRVSAWSILDPGLPVLSNHCTLSRNKFFKETFQINLINSLNTNVRVLCFGRTTGNERTNAVEDSKSSPSLLSREETA